MYQGNLSINISSFQGNYNIVPNEKKLSKAVKNNFSCILENQGASKQDLQMISRLNFEYLYDNRLDTDKGIVVLCNNHQESMIPIVMFI